MDFLSAPLAAALLRVTEQDGDGRTLLEHAAPYLKLTPHLILDLDGLFLTSMHLGELVNVVQAYQQQWGDRFKGLMLVQVSGQARQVLVSTRLETVMRPFPTADAALEALKANG